MIDLGIQLSVSAFIALFFAGSGFHKLRYKADFERALAGYGFLPNALLKLIAIIMPFFEIAVAALIVLPAYNIIGNQLAIALFGFYGLMIAIALLSGKAGADCGCGWGNSNKSTPMSSKLVVRNVVLALIAGITLIEPTVRDIIWLDYITASLTAITAILLYQAYETYLSVIEFQKEQSL